MERAWPVGRNITHLLSLHFIHLFFLLSPLHSIPPLLIPYLLPFLTPPLCPPVLPLLCPPLPPPQSTPCSCVWCQCWSGRHRSTLVHCQPPHSSPGLREPAPILILLHAAQTHQHSQHVGGCTGRCHPSPDGVDSMHGKSRYGRICARGRPLCVAVPSL